MRVLWFSECVSLPSPFDTHHPYLKDWSLTMPPRKRTATPTVAPEETETVSTETTNETVNVKEIMPTISNGLWNALFVEPSLIASVEIKKIPKMVNGKITTTTGRVLGVAKNVLDSQTGGTRVPLPDEIELSSEHPWDSLRSVFDESIKSL